jgi:ABC-2 type transport system permease protein
VLYDVSVTAAQARPVGDGYEVLIDVAGRQFEATGNGVENEVPLDTWFQVGVFPQSTSDVTQLEPSYLEHHRLRSGTQQITVRVAEKPGLVGIDPFHLMIDRKRGDNLLGLP